MHSGLTGFAQGVARFARNNERSRLATREVTPMSLPEHQPAADWVPPTWEQIVRDHSSRVYRLAYRLTGNPHDAEDLTGRFRPRLPLAAPIPARHPRGVAASDHHEPVSRWCPPKAEDPLRRAGRRSGRPAGQRLADAVRSSSPTPTSTMMWPLPLPPCRQNSERRSCSATSKVSATRRSLIAERPKIGTVRSRIHRAGPSRPPWLIVSPPGNEGATWAWQLKPVGVWSRRGQGEGGLAPTWPS